MRKFIFLLALASFSLSACTKKHDANPNIYHFVNIAKVKGMDPAGAEDLYSNYEIVRVYEALLQYHPFKRPYVLEPLLAEAMPTISKDGLTYTFKIRKGVFFHDDPAFPEGKGRELKAQDFVYSFLRLADPRTLSTGFWIFEGRIKGLDEWHEKYSKEGAGPTNFEEEVAGIKALDDYTLQIQLKQAYPQLLYALAMTYTSAVPREAVEKYGKEFINHAVGTGPFLLDTYNPAERITYKRNPKYWAATFPADGPAEDAGKTIPFIDGVESRIIGEDQPRWLHFMKGELDTLVIPKDNFDQAIKVLDPSKPASGDNIELLPELKDKGIQLAADVMLDITFNLFNAESTNVPALRDKRVRQAIALAMNGPEVIRLFYNNRAIPAQTPIPPNLNGYDADFKNPYRTNDIEKAKKLLAQAGYPMGKGIPEIPYDTLADATARQMAEHVQKSMGQIGIKLKMVSNTWPAMLKRMQNHQTDFWGYAWGADYPDAENFLQLFYGPNAKPGGMNAGYYKNKDYDRLFEKARAMQDTPERAALYKKLAQTLAEDTPAVFGAHRINVTLRQSWLKNALYDEFPMNRAKYLRIDLEAKKKAGH